MKRHNLVIISWVDSCTTMGWKSIRDPSNFRTSEITSAGWLIHEDKTSVTISTSISENGNTTEPLTIPKSAIKRRQKLKFYVQGEG